MFTIGLTYFVILFTSVACKPKDVVFVLDRSLSLQEEDFVQAVDFVYNVTKWLPISDTDFHVSVVTYSDKVKEEFALGYMTSRNDILKMLFDIRGKRKPSGGTETDNALKYVSQKSFLPIHGGRPRTDRVVIVITDGESDDPVSTEHAADDLKLRTRAEVFAVGVGSALLTANRELAHIASSPTEKYVQKVHNYLHLCSLVPSLVAKLDPLIFAKVNRGCPIAVNSTLAEAVSEKIDNDTTPIFFGVITTAACIATAAGYVAARYIKRSRFSRKIDDQFHVFDDKNVETSVGPSSTTCHTKTSFA